MLAKLHHEAEYTKQRIVRIVEVRRQAKATDAVVAEHARQASEATRREEVRQASIREEAAKASAISAEATKLVAAQAMAEARKHDGCSSGHCPKGTAR